MLTALRIGNFKAFAESQLIPIRPLTLIYGANSSGKSSILHSLILARHAQETGDLDVHRTNVGGESVDLGGFRQYVHRREANRRVELALEFDKYIGTNASIQMLASLNKLLAIVNVGISLDNQGNPILGSVPEIITYEIADDKKTLARMSRRRSGLAIDLIDLKHPIFINAIKRRFGHFFDRRRSNIDWVDFLTNAVEKAIPNLLILQGKLLPENIAFQFKDKKTLTSFTPQEFQAFTSIRNTEEFQALQSFIRSFIPQNIERSLQNDMEFAIRGCLDILNEFTSVVALQIKEEIMCFRYLGPLRSYPPRHLAFSQHHDPNWYAGGGYAWDVIRHDANVRKLVNEWLSAPDRLQTPYELRIRHLLTIDDLDSDYTKVIEALEQRFTGEEPYDWDLFGELYSALEKIKQNEANLTDIQELNLVDMRSNTIVSHRDVGIGVSQVLPVLVTSYASQNQIIAIEQPEIHLHPALQADLGDVFIQSALGPGRNRFLIETHSEHLLLRVMRRMRETSNDELPEGVPPITPKDVCVLFVQPKGTSSAVRHLELDEEGQLLDPWPGGFFEEGYRERFA